MILGLLGVEEAGGLRRDLAVEDEFGGVGIGGGLDVDDFEGHGGLQRSTAETAVAHKGRLKAAPQDNPARIIREEFTVGGERVGSRLQIKAF